MLLTIVAIIITIIIVFIVAVYVFMQQPKFGTIPTGERMERIKRSPNYVDGKFQNQHPTPDLTDGATLFSVLRDFIFRKSKRGKPAAALPSKKTNLLNLPEDDNILVWFGHSSYFMQVDGKKILVDPVLSGHASPLKFTTKSFAGSDVYTTDDFPPIDYLFISHDHWDHLDYETILKLKPKIKLIITSLGTGAHLERWGFNRDMIVEKDWNEELILDKGFKVNTVPARHFSGRGFKRQQALWLSFVLQTPTMKIFIGGDSGYDTHFATIGEKFGPFDLAVLECGQYNKSWKHIHMMPEEVVMAAQELKAKKFMPVHWSKFTLALHSWDDPIIRVTAAAAKNNVPIVHPMIGEALDLKNPTATTAWWQQLD